MPPGCKLLILSVFVRTWFRSNHVSLCNNVYMFLTNLTIRRIDGRLAGYDKSIIHCDSVKVIYVSLKRNGLLWPTY